jgi:hypothetical protein
MFLAEPVVTAACIFFRTRAMGAAGSRPSLRPLYERVTPLRTTRACRVARRRGIFSCHRPPPGPASGRPDDRLRRTIQYSETVVIESRSRGVLDSPPSRGMTGNAGNDSGGGSDSYRPHQEGFGASGTPPEPAPFCRSFMSVHYRSLTRSPARRKADDPIFISEQSCWRPAPSRPDFLLIFLEKA